MLAKWLETNVRNVATIPRPPEPYGARQPNQTLTKENETMKRYRTAIGAQEEAHDKGLFWGVCVFDGRFFVGTRDELAKIGVVIHKQANPPKQLTLNPLPVR